MTPKTFIVGVTQPDYKGLKAYLEHTGQLDFMASLEDFMAKSNSDPLCLVSFYAKLCYKSLVLGRNANVARVRDIQENLEATLKSGHGSVFEHVWINFVTTGCSRVFTHELVRHRVGTAFSQTSGRYVALDKIDLVLPPELAGDVDVNELRARTEMCLKKLREKLIKPDMDFALKKKLTSAIRRLAPNGQDNEIGWSVNVRALRHLVELRTSRHAEWEIRLVFNEVAELVQERWPIMLHGGEIELVDGFNEWKGLHV